ncbi:MAG: hypothetical protein FWD84_05280 [Oscillospiraceae bacterium]|nr:hypothetical protein [Oscillospiraceae bacterium]
MKKRLAFLLAVILLLTGCGGLLAESDDGVVLISERFFVTQTTQIQMNAGDYLGRTIRYEGMFWGNEWPTGEVYYFVTRNTLGCCGDDGIIGFELRLNDFDPLPNDTWVEITGVLEEFDYEGRTFLRLAVVELTELEERGLEFVE